LNISHANAEEHESNKSFCTSRLFLETGQPIGECFGSGGFGAEGESSPPSLVVFGSIAEQRQKQIALARLFGTQSESQFVLDRLADDGIFELERSDGPGVEFIGPEEEDAAGARRVQLAHDPMTMAFPRCRIHCQHDQSTAALLRC